MKTGERIVRGRLASVNKTNSVSLCIAAENVAKLFSARKKEALARASSGLEQPLRFFFDEDFNFGDDVAEDFDLYRIFAESFEGFG